MTEVAQILSAIDQGDPAAAEKLLPLVYDELRKLASQRMSQEKPGHTLQGTALVHEAYLRLVGAEQAQQWDSRGHFFAAAAEAMRRILIENARHKKSLKEGGDRSRVELPPATAAANGNEEFDLLSLNDALDALAATDSRKAELVKLRVFAGMPLDDAAHGLGISSVTANRDWIYAKA